MMRLEFAEFEELCEELGFTHYPRSVGNPRQHFIFTPEEAYSSFSDWDGYNSCFISTQGYDGLGYDGGGKQLPTQIQYRLTFFDFDHDTKPENAYADAVKLSQYLEEHDVAHWVQYSGSKGYHLFILHTPTLFKFKHTDGTADALRRIVNQTQTQLKILHGLNTLDVQTTGDPKRLCRFPFTTHVNRHGEKSGRMAMPLTRDMLYSGHDNIVAHSYRPKNEGPFIIGSKKLTLKELIRFLDLKINKDDVELRPIIPSEIKVDVETGLGQFLASLEVRCPGVVNELRSMNPYHKSRVHTAMYAKSIGIDIDTFDSLWVELAHERGYVDVENHKYRRHQLESIFHNDRYHTNANCTTLKRDRCCIGEACPKYIEAFPKKKTVKRKWRKIDGTRQ